MNAPSARLACVAALLAALAVWTQARPTAAQTQPPALAATLPLAFADWVGREAPPLEPDVARVLAADEYVHRYYGPRGVSRYERTANGDDRVEMDVAYYATPQAGAAMHSPLNCLPGNGWQIIETRTVPMRIGSSSVDVRRLVVDRKGDRVAMTYWFQNRGAVVAKEFEQRVRLLTNGLHGAPTDAALVRVMTRDTAAGRASLERFTRALIQRLRVVFG